MRLDKFLAHTGFGTRKETKKLLRSGQVQVNGIVIKEGKHQVNPKEDVIQHLSETIHYREFIYLMLHKPPGYLSATKDDLQPTVLDLIHPDEQIFQLFPVGRLDKDTEGLLLLTNDGKLAHNLLSPKKRVPKTYFARVQGEVTEGDRLAFEEGVILDDGYQTLPATLLILEAGSFSEVELTISEGKFHQVKRMFQARGKEVVYLKRVSMGSLVLDPHLDMGEYRELTDEELENLQDGEWGVE